jgi:hypothetical protein
VKIYVIKKGSGYLDHCEFFVTKESAMLRFYTLADKFRQEYGFKMDANSFVYQAQELPDDDGGYVRLSMTFIVTDIDVKE